MSDDDKSLDRNQATTMLTEVCELSVVKRRESCGLCPTLKLHRTR
jgi:hypothetical protein